MLQALLLAVLLVSLSCAAPAGPTLETGPNHEITHDGLHRVSRTRRFQRAWVKPNTNLGSYSKLLVIDAGIHYKRPPHRNRPGFALSEGQMENLRSGLKDAIVQELDRDESWQVVGERGPDTLILRAAIIDLIVTAAPQTAGRERSFGSSVGEATLVVELFDSQSFEILVRIADRRAITRDTGSWENTAINNRAAAQRVFRNWARRLRKGLEAARTFGQFEDEEAPDQPEG